MVNVLVLSVINRWVDWWSGQNNN